jgi:hypothetical protein
VNIKQEHVLPFLLGLLIFLPKNGKERRRNFKEKKKNSVEISDNWTMTIPLVIHSKTI